MRGKAPDPDVKAAAVAGIMAGKTIRQVSAETGLSVTAVHRIRSGMPEQLEQLGTEKTQHLGGLIAEHFRTQLEALNAYATHTSTPEYVRAQTASDMATLYGAVAGNALRLLDIATRVGVSGKRGEREP